jgi:hypothetical protein
MTPRQESCAATAFRRGWSPRHNRHKPDGYEHRRADRVPPHRGIRSDGGIVASLGYMVGAAILTPDLWIEPLGALVKTGPAVVLMLVALLTLDNSSMPPNDAKAHDPWPTMT